MGNLKVEPLLDQHLKPIKSGDELTPLNISTERVTYNKLATDNDELVNKYYADNHYAWQTTVVGGYKTNNNSSSYYYTKNDPTDSRWIDSDSSISSIDTDMATTSSIFVCVKNTVITHFYMTGYASDTGFDDPFRFHLYSALPADGDSANTTTFLWQTDRITPSVSGRNVVYDTVVDNVTVDKNQRLYLLDSLRASNLSSFPGSKYLKIEPLNLYPM